MASRAEYMRKYRRRKKLEARGLVESDDVIVTIQPRGTDNPSTFRAKDSTEMIGILINRIVALENELALTNTIVGPLTTTRSGQWVPEYRPVPKPSARK